MSIFLPQFLIQKIIPRFSILTGVTAIEPEWLPILVPHLCTFSKPLEQPIPTYHEESGSVHCHMSSTFGEFIIILVLLMRLFNPEWLPVLLPHMCRFSKPLEQPIPTYHEESGSVHCHMSSTFGEFMIICVLFSKVNWARVVANLSSSPVYLSKPLIGAAYSPAKWWRHKVATGSRYCFMHQCSIGLVLWSVRSWFKTSKAWTGRPEIGSIMVQDK